MFQKILRALNTPVVWNSETGAFEVNNVVLQTGEEFSNTQAAFAFVLFVVFPVLVVGAALLAML